MDCADCPTSRRCWEGDPPAPKSGFLVQAAERLERNAVLTLPSNRSGMLFIVASGCVALRERLVDGRSRTAAYRLPGELVGLESWTRASHPYEIRAVAPSALCRLTLPRQAAGGVSSSVLERLLLKSAAQIDRAMRPWPALPATERVAAFIEDFVERARIKGSSSRQVRLPMTRADIASHLGLSEETVVRALATLKRSLRLEVNGKLVGLCFPQALAARR
jgi:CRP/FNR family transcriptional regulator